MNPLTKRIKAVEKELKKRNGDLFTVYYKDGTTKRIRPGDAISLCLEEADRIERFEEDEDGSNNGILEGLVNALLLPGEGKEA